MQEDIVRYLIKALVASRRLDKKRNSIETEKMEFLTGYAKDANDDAGKSLEKYIKKWGFYPKYDQVVKTDEYGNPLYVIATDKKGNPLYNKDGSPLYKQKLNEQKKPLFENGKPVYEVQVKMVERNDFFYKIGGDSTIEKDGKVYQTLTGFGLTYFCTIFLSKPQAKQMQADVKLFERSPYPEDLNNIIRDMLSIYRIRSPKGKKLEATDNKATLALDMLNELRKCPKELYDVLGTNGQRYFEDKVKRPNERTPEVVKRIRSNDRFPYLAMRYIDETNLFANIRFQVQLGKFRFKFYPKTCINGEEEIRSLQKEINGFGRLQEIEQKRQTEYKTFLQESKEKSVKIEGENMYLDLLQFEKDQADSKQYITDNRAYYNIHNNRIGLNWNERVITDKDQNQRTLLQYGDYLPSLKDVKDGKAPVEMPAPMAMLSIYELPSLVFYDYLLKVTGNNDNSKSAENIIINKYHRLLQFFLDVSNGVLTPVDRKRELSQRLQSYDLDINEIPQKLVKYLTKKKVDINIRKQKLTRDKLVKLLKRAIRRRNGFKDDRKMIGNKDNKYGKDSYVDVRHGSLARYLSESFLEWQPSDKDGHNKLTGLNFSKLQAELALFDNADKFVLIKQMLKDAGLLDGSFKHPFLDKVAAKSIRNIEELYITYLDEEVKHIKSVLGISNYDDKKIIDNKVDFEKLPMPVFDYSQLPFIKGEARWEERTADNYKQLAARYVELDGKRASIWLPDGMFTHHILEILKTHFSSNKELQAKLSDESLSGYGSYLIRMYFEHQLDDHSQPYYSSSVRISDKEVIPSKFAHIYNLFNILNNVKKNNAYKPVPMTVKDINAKFATNAQDKDGDLIERLDSKGKPQRDEKQNILYKKVIHVEIEKRVDSMTFKEKGNHKTPDAAKEAMRRKLTHLISEVKDNEKAIRRYKTQDMIMFLMAERLMEQSDATGNVSKSDKFKLENVCHSDFLSQTVNFEFPFVVGDDTILITQEVMSLKNLGEFYQLLSDDRLPSLLKKLIEAKKKDKQEAKVSYSNLMGELASYDIKRSNIFRAIHQLEKFVVSKKDFQEFLNDPDNEQFYIANDKTRDPKRNNFRELLYLLEKSDEDILNSDAKEFIISIRNAFSHNHYDVDFNKIASADMMKKSTLMHENSDGNKKEELTTIATLIAKRLEELQKLVCEGLA